MRLVENVKPQGKRHTVHIADDSVGTSLCGRMSLESSRLAPTGAEVTCRWCRSVEAKGKEPAHKATMVCRECGEAWPCASFSEGRPGRCTGLTAAGKPCTRKARYFDKCGVHLDD